MGPLSECEQLKTLQNAHTRSHVHMRGHISVTGVQTPEIHLYNTEQ